MYLTASQIKKKYGIPKNIVYENIKNGNITITDFGKNTFYIEENDLIKFFESKKINFKQSLTK